MTIRYSLVDVELYTGDIVEADTECILNPTDGKLTLAGSVATQLISKEPKLIQEIYKLRLLFTRFV